jgi:hypothetical protein
MHGLPAIKIIFSKEDGSEMDVDTTPQVSIKHGLPEIKIYCYLVILIFLIDNKKYDEECLGFSSDLIFIGEHANFLSNKPVQALHV